MNKTNELILSAEEIKKIRKSKGLEIKSQEEIVGILDTELGKLITQVVINLSESEKSSAEIMLGSESKKSVENIGKKEGRCKYIKGKNNILDAIIKYLEEKGYKIIFFNRNYKAGDYSGDSRIELGTFMSIGL